MENGKLIIAIVFIIIFFIFMPKIFTFAFSGLNSGSFVNSNAVHKTLSVPEEGRKGIIAVSYNYGDEFETAQVHTASDPQIYAINTYKSFYIAGTNSGLLISRDGGINWYPFTDLENSIDTKVSIYDFVRGPGGTLYMAAYKNNHGVIYVTNDNFFTATPIWTESKMATRAVNADGNYLYFGLDDGRLLRYSFYGKSIEKVTSFTKSVQNLTFVENGTLFVSLKDGSVYTENGTRNKFTKVKTPTGKYISSQSGLQFTNDTSNPGSLFIAYTGGIFSSENGGSIWNEINSILGSKAKIAALAVQNGMIYVTSEAKFYKSKDGGESWIVSEPMPATKNFGTLYTENNGKTVIVGTRK